MGEMCRICASSNGLIAGYSDMCLPRAITFSLVLPALGLLLLAGCGSPTMDLAGYPDAAHDRLYRDGRLGDDKGLADFDLRKAWHGIADTGDPAR
jgi:hypothetical protein